jgi:murein DD-endopeptidase MepM/ murein hydrolase activator NlpD
VVAGWEETASQSPLAQTDWSNYFANQVPNTGWWNQSPAPFSYGPEMNMGASFDYDPGGVGTTYSPTSGLTMQMIDSDIENWLRREHPELFDFTTGVQYGGVAGVGTVAQDPGFGQFSKTPEVYGEIQAAANKYGVPANFLQAIIAKESSGNWAGNSRPVAVASRGGKRIHGYVGVFEDAARLWGFDFDALIGNRAGQIEMLASGLRRMYDQIRTRNPQYGWLNVAAMHYSGDPDMNYTPGDSFQHGTTREYVAEAESWWKSLDAKAGNTWSNYTDTTQNTGIGSPQNQQWGRYAQWDEAIVGVSANQGAPANLLKAILRYGDESGLGYSNSFDNTFVPAAETLTNNYRRLGDWDAAITATFNVQQNSPQHRRIKQYWDELNADMSGVFGGQPSGDPSQFPRTQAEAIWGGIPYEVSQEHASTWFAVQHPDWYEYSLNVVGYLSHPGADISIPNGTRLYAPVGGTVIRAGYTGSYESERGGEGELRIRTDAGHELILGHMQAIDVQIGMRVTPGMYVGTSGTANGDHLHLEYRIPDSTKNGGWAAIDPFQALSGNFTGFHQGAKQGLGYTQPMTFQALMRAGASGQAIPSGPVYSQGGGNSAWTTWLRNEMLGLGNPDTSPRRIDYGSLYTTSPGGIT